MAKQRGKLKCHRDPAGHAVRGSGGSDPLGKFSHKRVDRGSSAGVGCSKQGGRREVGSGTWQPDTGRVGGRSTVSGCGTEVGMKITVQPTRGAGQQTLGLCPQGLRDLSRRGSQPAALLKAERCSLTTGHSRTPSDPYPRHLQPWGSAWQRPLSLTESLAHTATGCHTHRTLPSRLTTAPPSAQMILQAQTPESGTLCVFRLA